MVEKTESVCEILTGFNVLLLKNMNIAYQPALKRMIQSISDCAGNIKVKKLSNDVCYSEHQLNRIFKQYVGISTKLFSSLI